jgi:hypothetical protein
MKSESGIIAIVIVKNFIWLHHPFSSLLDLFTRLYNREALLKAHASDL